MRACMLSGMRACIPGNWILYGSCSSVRCVCLRWVVLVCVGLITSARCVVVRPVELQVCGVVEQLLRCRWWGEGWFL